MTYAIFIWHGSFLALTMSMIDFNTVFPAMITELVNSKVVFGIIYSLMLGMPYLSSLLFAHFLSAYRYRKRFLIIGVYLRALAFLGMAAFMFFFGIRLPWLVVGSFFLWSLLFSLSGGFAGISYDDIVGKLVAKSRRGRLYAIKQFTSSLASFAGGWVIAHMFGMSTLRFPSNYAALLLIGFLGLVIAAIAFWFIKEPASKVSNNRRPKLSSLLARVPVILKSNPEFARFIVIENLSSFSLMIMPFYMLYAIDMLHVNDVYIGRYLLYQVGGKIASNVLWGWAAGRLGNKRTVELCLLLGGIIPVVALSIIRLGPDFFGLVFLLVGSVYSGRRVGFMPYLLDIIPADERPVYLGIRGTLNVLVVLLPLLGGLAISFAGYLAVFSLVSGAMLASFLFLYLKPSAQH